MTAFKWELSDKERQEIIKCVLEFIKRVSDGKNVSPEETAILPEMTKILL